MKRMENETSEQYKIRRLKDKQEQKQKLKGKLIWDSKAKGTKVKENKNVN